MANTFTLLSHLSGPNTIPPKAFLLSENKAFLSINNISLEVWNLAILGGLCEIYICVYVKQVYLGEGMKGIGGEREGRSDEHALLNYKVKERLRVIE